MNICKIKNLTIGDGRVKICVPIVCKTKEEVILNAKKIKSKKSDIDIVEFRADYYLDIFNLEKTIEVLKELKNILNDIPIIFTIRSKKEGGELEIDIDKYVELNKNIIKSNLIDTIDVEIFIGDNYVNDIVDLAHRKGIKVIGSNHDFENTPSKEEIINRVKKMQILNTDIIKIAVMPKDKKDVIELISATEEVVDNFLDRPIIAISMGKEGIITRISSEIFGSCITFASLDRVSAPGQINIDDLKKILDIIHLNIH